MQKRLHASVQKKNATFRACRGILNPLHTCSGEIFKNAETGHGGAETGATKKKFPKKGMHPLLHMETKKVFLFSKSNPPMEGDTFSATYHVAGKFRVFLQKKKFSKKYEKIFFYFFSN